MASRATPRAARSARHARVRKNLAGTTQRPRLAVFRSSQHIYAQVIDDVKGRTLAASSTVDEKVAAEGKGKKKAELSVMVGKQIAERAIAQGITQVAFDRGGFKYHGRVRAVADAAREAGLKF